LNENTIIGFIGTGTMGRAIIKGLLDSGFTSKNKIIASEIVKRTAENIQTETGINIVDNNPELVKKSDVIVICTKPNTINAILKEIKDFLTDKKTVISIAAGVETKQIEDIIGKNISVIRVMPNTPALVKEGMTVISKGSHASNKDVEFAFELFSKIGKCVEIDEKYMNAVTGISGSGPAFIYVIIEALADGGVKLGIPKHIALELAAQTTLGAAKMVIETGKHPAILKDEVTTPGGCTAAGLMVLEENRIRALISKTVQETAKKSADLV